MQPEISVIICTLNRAAFVEKCIESLLVQTAPADEYEIIVVDNGSKDHTWAICRKYEPMGVQYCYEPVTGLSQARNSGWRASSGKYIGYMDDDATAGRNWVKGALDGFELDQNCQWLGGPINLEFERPAPTWLCETLRKPLGEVYMGESARPLEPGEWLGGGNSVYTADFLESVGGFDTRIGRKQGSLLSGEETQLRIRLEQQGGLLYYHPDVSINHWVSSSRLRPGWFYRRFYWGGITDYFLARTLSEMGVTNGISAGDTGARDTLGQRFVKNLSYASGLSGGATERILGRVYFSYIWGWLNGIKRWHLGKR